MDLGTREGLVPTIFAKKRKKKVASGFILVEEGGIEGGRGGE